MAAISSLVEKNRLSVKNSAPNITYENRKTSTRTWAYFNSEKTQIFANYLTPKCMGEGLEEVSKGRRLLMFSLDALPESAILHKSRQF